MLNYPKKHIDRGTFTGCSYANITIIITIFFILINSLVFKIIELIIRTAIGNQLVMTVLFYLS